MWSDAECLFAVRIPAYIFLEIFILHEFIRIQRISPLSSAAIAPIQEQKTFSICPPRGDERESITSWRNVITIY